MANRKKAVVLDFDGVIHSYTSKFKFPFVIPDPPVNGAMEWLHENANKLTIRILSTRNSNERGLEAMKKWILKWGLEKCGPDFEKSFKRLKFVDPTKGKPKAQLYIDDRGFHFKGTFPTLEFIEGFKAWNK
jgi:hypothetical protein